MSATICARCSRQQHDACTTPACSCAMGDHKRIATEPKVAAPLVVWEEPVRPKRGRGSVPPITDEQMAAIKERPGQWARVKTWPASSSAATCHRRIKKGEHASIDPKLVETAAGMVDGGSALWARWIGES